MLKKVAARYESGDGFNSGILESFPVEEFKKSAVAMGVLVSDFHNMCMFEFQIIREVYCLRYGLNEDGSDPEKMTLDELDELKRLIEEKNK